MWEDRTANCSFPLVLTLGPQLLNKVMMKQTRKWTMTEVQKIQAWTNLQPDTRATRPLIPHRYQPAARPADTVLQTTAPGQTP
eukprot:6467121-Amphidinium_carterae.1